MYKLTLLYESKGKTSGVFIVNPDHYREIHGDDLVELLAKFLLEVVNLQRDIHQEELAELRSDNDNIPF